jgi:hypothetical protein
VRPVRRGFLGAGALGRRGFVGGGFVGRGVFGVPADAGVDRDATSSKYVPSSAAQFTALGLTAPSSIWLLQMASGNASDSVGSLTLTAANTPQYQQSATGWTRVGVGFTDGSTMRFSAAAGTGPDPTTTSTLWLFYTVIRTEPTSTRIVGGATRIDQSSDCVRQVWSPSAGTNRLNMNCDGVGANGAALADHAAGSHPIVVKYDRTNSACVAFSEIDKATTTYSAAVVDGAKGLGSNSTPDMVCVYAAMWSGAAAEMSNATIKTMLTTLGWSPTWTP